MTDMRMTTEDWLAGEKNSFKFSGSQHRYSGIVHPSHAMMIVPFSNRARLDMMTKHGQPYSAEKNEKLMDSVMSNPVTMSVENLRMALKSLEKKELWKYRDAHFEPKFIKMFIKHYTRKEDHLTIWFKGTVMHIVCPDGAWGCFIAPYIVNEEKAKTFNPLTGEME